MVRLAAQMTAKVGFSEVPDATAPWMQAGSVVHASAWQIFILLLFFFVPLRLGLGFLFLHVVADDSLEGTE
jgi:hypothetical protein